MFIRQAPSASWCSRAMRPSSPSSVRGIAQATLKIGFFSSDQLGGQSECGAARGGRTAWSS